MKNVHYINAGAGAGKTTTLVNKLSEILKDPNNKPAEIILTTFTKAAAKEFREKTFKQLLKDGSIQAAKSLDTATIGTVHSVAEQYIKRYWSLLGYSGQFNILTDVDKKKYINHSLYTFVDAADLDFFYQYALDFKLGKDGAENWKEIIVDIISKANAYHIKFDKFSIFSKQSCDVVDRLFVHTFNMTTFQSKAHDYVEFLKKAPTNTTLHPSTKKAAAGKLDAYNAFVALSTSTIDDFSILENGKFFGDIAGRDQTEIDSAENAKNYLDVCKTLTPDNGDKVKGYIKRIFEIAGKWAQYYEDYKSKNNLLDFDDLEINFLKLLKHKDIAVREAVRNDIRSSIKYVFVDEFQDSSPIQLEIFQELSELVKQSYWVGDPKQAIYGFRGSDSSLTTDLLKSFPDPVTGKISGVPAIGCTSELLDTSYRSIESLVELANEVFDKSFANGVPSEIIRNVRLKVKRPDGNIKTPIQHWYCENVKALATRVANILNGDVSNISGVYEGDANNPKWRAGILPSDIAVLCRTGTQCTTVADALREKGIPVATPETSIMDNAEVKLVMALLKYVKCQRYAKVELSKLLENKELEDILKDIANGRFNYDSTDNKKTEGLTATKSATVPSAAVTTRDLFEILDERLRNLWGLNISAIVKGIIAALDLYNVVAKWGKAAIRRDNLNTLIKQAVAFEQSTASTTDSASISSFIKYLKNVEIDAQLDNGVEGVKVATYHKSKGLQWKIVILYSLDSNSLEISDFVEKEWCRLNLKTDEATKESELQLIPPIGNISNGVAEKVEELAGEPAGSDDNGYYNLRHGKIEGELKRLLYVGVTRARDYLVTVSLKGSKDNPSTPLSWMKNVMGKASTVALDTIDGFTDKTPVDLWGVKGHESFYEKLDDDPAITYSGTMSSYQKLKDIPINTETESKRISPSSSKEKYNATHNLVKDFSNYIEHDKKIDDSAAFGTCIHNYMAAHRWEGKNKINDHKQSNIDLARQTVENHNLKKELPQPKLLTEAADALFTYLESEFGAGELLRETPFSYRRNNGQLVAGEIDLIWKTDKECILLDYKNFPAPKDVGTKMVSDPKNEHYVGKYFPQLGDYRAALTAAGENVTHVFIFYAVMGCLVEIKFE